jgi:hypothetical protein
MSEKDKLLKADQITLSGRDCALVVRSDGTVESFSAEGGGMSMIELNGPELQHGPDWSIIVAEHLLNKQGYYGVVFNHLSALMIAAGKQQGLMEFHSAPGAGQLN